LKLAKIFATHYPFLTGQDPGVNADHDFVTTLNEIFDALNFKARAQNYAKMAVKALKKKSLPKPLFHHEGNLSFL
jgi:hypothetical protein